MLSDNKTLDCALLKTPENAFYDIDSSYIYSFINKQNHRFYIGSTINPTSRLHNYIYSWTTSRQGLLREMRTTGGGFNNYYFFAGYKVPNYLNLFIQNYPHIKLDTKSIFILNCFSEFHVKLLEQSIISHLKPEINDINTAVSYTFVSIDIENYNPPLGLNSHSISVYDKEGNLFNEYLSINKAKSALGLSEYDIRWNRNRLNHFVFCPKPKLELKIVDNTLQNIFVSAPLSYHKKLIPITGINLENIPTGVISAYLDDKETLFDIFNSASDFAAIHKINPWQAYRYINLEKLIPISDGILYIYLCCNPIYRQTLLDNQDKRNWPVVSIDTENNNLVRFHDNPNACRTELSTLLGLTKFKPSRNFTQDYITGALRNGKKSVPSKFKKRFIIKWLKDFTEE
jgi:hypothetical protein